MVTWHGPKIHKTQKEKASQTSTDHHLYERQTAVFCQLFQTFSQIHQLVCRKRAVSSFYWQRCYCIHLLQMNLRRYWNSRTQGGSCIQISSSWTTCLLQETVQHPFPLQCISNKRLSGKNVQTRRPIGCYWTRLDWCSPHSLTCRNICCEMWQ